MPNNTFPIESRSVSSVRVNGRLRTLDPEKLEELAASIKDIGLLSPPILSSDNFLLAGAHRLAAVEMLGWKICDFKIAPYKHDSPEAGLIEIDENLQRKELTILEQSEYLWKRNQLLEQMGKRLKQGGQPVTLKTLKNEGVTKTPSFSKQNKVPNIGLTERTIQRRIQIARNLTEEQRELIRKTPLANEQKDLLEISKIKDPERRTGVIKLLLGEDPPQTVNEAVRLYRIDVGQITSELDVIKPSNWWAFGRPKWQQDGFKGGIPGEVYANALYYFGPSKGIVADGMAGSGMLRRVYYDRIMWQRNRQFDLEIKLYDMYPCEPFASQYDIKPHNMTKPLPEMVDWLFIDPPYYRIAENLYQGSLATTREYSTYCEIMNKIIQAASDSLCTGGVLCLFTTAYMDITNPSSENIDVPADMRNIAISVGFEPRARVYVSRGEQQRPNAGFMNLKAKMNLRMFSDVCELLVFTKGGKHAS
jgi:hypothetical protein